MKYVLGMMLILSSYTHAATIAVIDSGVDVEHNDLVNNIWMNENEIADNGRDEDANGYQDDIYGWNFAESNNLVIDRKYLGTFSDDPRKFFAIQGRSFLGTATEADKEWVKLKRTDKDFLKEMGKFGNFVHGTHVAGITVDGTDNKILSVKLIPTEVNPFKRRAKVEFDGLRHERVDIRLKALFAIIKTLAKQQMLLLEEIAAYVGSHDVDVANGSFGTGFDQAKLITDNLFKIAFFRKPTKKESDLVAKFFMDTLLEHGKEMVASAPDTLFVFAAGNSGSDNDLYPTSPTNVQADNVISVAATYKYEFIAPFSNYGEKMVDVAAPGMLINSQIPGNEYLEVSGTSQAAPMIARIAGEIKDMNKNLTPLEIKSIIMLTVDEKGFLKGKVKAAGIANAQRAVVAAKLSLTMDLSEAISASLVTVQDVAVKRNKSLVFPRSVTPIPLTPLFY